MKLIKPTYQRPPGLQGSRSRVLSSLAAARQARPARPARRARPAPVLAPARALALGALALGALALGAPAALATSRALVISGAGDGHGVGMSQEGALGYAEHGWSYEQILAHYYTGTTLGAAPAGYKVKVLVGKRVRTLPLETYVRGVVAAEMPSSWPLAALEAQAVASRTYALTTDVGGSRFDVYAGTGSQVYLGRAAETASSNAAIADTAGQVVTYAGKPATTYFFASSGGMTESIQNSFIGAAAEPWLLGVPDPYDQGPLHTWKVALSFAAAARRLRGLVRGRFEGIEVLKRGVSPRIVSADVLGSGGNTLVSGPELAARLELDSTWEYFSVSSAGKLTPEPDLSGYVQAPEPTDEAPPVIGPQGGAPAPATSTDQGGATAPATSTRQGGAGAAATAQTVQTGGAAAG